ncbi:DUF5937 family protein [Streptomyces clavuligerus]|uniref:DUF5937 family protein n=1 Tax=Streptomyces clavuligerus TaxID=1901 RepID=UPI001E59772C|nr:DUF5937 family protein [Streptomyces clavuligerus]
MSIVLDLGGLGPADVAAGPFALSELMASLHVLAEPEHHPEAAAWTARAAVADPGLRDELLVFAPLWARFRCRLFFPRSLPLTTGLDEELTALAELSADAFLDLVAPGILGSTAQPVPPARELRPSATAAREYIRRCQRRSYARGELAGQLVAAPLELRDRPRSRCSAPPTPRSSPRTGAPSGPLWRSTPARCAAGSRSVRPPRC